MKATAALVLLATSFILARSAGADLFGSGDNAFDVEFVAVGDSGNVADTTGFPNPAGSVDYDYRIGIYEISEDIINKANVLGSLGITHDNRGANKPATSVSWFEAARFVNWLNASTGSAPAYKFDGSGDFQVWESGDEGYNPDNLYRNSLAKYYLPSTHEWYKAAYYDPDPAVYYNYPTGSDSQPDGLQDELDPEFDAVFFDGDHNSEPNDANNVGIPSPYGTRGQGGNVAEWIESAESLNNGQPPVGRHVRGGQWDDNHTSLRSNIVGGGNASTGHFFVGFRLASVSVAVLVGDYNQDGKVSAADYTVWRDHFGAATLPNRDPDNMGSVNLDDFDSWKEHYGEGSFGSGSGTNFGIAGASLPEPSSLVLVLAAVAVATIHKRRWCD
jgi:hypothetical protein